MVAARDAASASVFVFVFRQVPSGTPHEARLHRNEEDIGLAHVLDERATISLRRHAVDLDDVGVPEAHPLDRDGDLRSELRETRADLTSSSGLRRASNALIAAAMRSYMVSAIVRSFGMNGASALNSAS